MCVCENYLNLVENLVNDWIIAFPVEYYLFANITSNSKVYGKMHARRTLRKKNSSEIQSKFDIIEE